MESKYEQWAEAKFEGLSREELREAGSVLGCSFAPNTSVPTMRNKLCEAVGQGVTPDVTHVANIEQTKLPRFRRPRLSASDVWEGRRHLVTVHRPHGLDHKCVEIVWDGVPRTFEYGVEVKMPEPHYNILKGAIIKDVKQRAVKDSEGRLERMESYDVASPRYSFNYNGVDPATKDLPGSILEYWQQQAKKHNFFRDLAKKSTARKALIQIRSDLYGPVGEAFYKDLTNEDILHSILQFLGFEDEMYDDLHSALEAA